MNLNAKRWQRRVMHPQARRPRSVTRLEALEDRTLLSVCLVDRLTDLGEGKGFVGDLRYCIEQTQDKDSIQFAVKGTINLTRALPDLTRSISIEGPGADLLTVQQRRIPVSSTATVSISGLTLSNGSGITNLGGTLTISNSTISRNGSYFGGGGIFNSGTLTVSNSTISRNWGGELGGGIDNQGTLTINNSTISENWVFLPGVPGYGGGIYNSGTATISNSTISSNFVDCDDYYECFGFSLGGGIFNSIGATVSLTNSTISRNSAWRGFGGGIYSGGTLNARNTIIAGNTDDLDGKLTSGSHNFIGGNPMLGPLQDNGGPTFTHALLPGSPAIDTGDNTDAPEWDQRGPGFPRIANDVIDIGAFEVQLGAAPSFRQQAPGARAGQLLAADLVGALTWRRPRTDWFGAALLDVAIGYRLSAESR